MRKKFTILSVSALLALVSLASCSNSSECPVCEEEPDDNDDNNPSDNPGENPGDNPDEPDPSEGLIDKEESPWNEEITNLMFNSLGGAILPFVDLGDGEIQAEYVKNDEDNDYKSYLELVGGSFLASHLKKTVETYKEHYWNTVMVGDSFYASNELIDVSVEIYKNYNNLFELRAYYDEPFNPADATEWDDVTSLLISEHFGRFEVPFTYLGTVNYDSSINGNGALVVTGGTWNDQVLGEFNAVFKDWTISTDEEILTTLYATHEVDGSKLSATIEQVNSKAQLTVSLEESFSKENQSSWSKEVQVAMDRSLNKTILPYVYLGSVYPTIDTASTNERSITLVGKIWDNEILENAKSAFETDGGWESVASETSITFSKAIGNEDFEVVIEQNAEGVPVLRASREEIYNESTLTDYPEAIKTAFKDKYGEDISIIPYLYLGTSSPTINNEIPAEHEQDIHKLVITGGKYDARVLEQFKAKFTSSNNEWYVEIDNFEEDYGSDYDKYGDVLAVAIQSFEKFTYKVGLFTLGNGDEKTVYLEINRSENSGTQATGWSKESLANLEKVLGSDVEIPYFDIGRNSLEFIFNEDGHLEFQFVADANNISYRVWCAIDALTKKDWDVKLAHNDTYYNDEVWISSINATKDFNGKKVSINIEVDPTTDYRFAMFGNVKLVESYDSSKESGSWNNEIKKAISDRYKIDLPFIYLGTDNPYIYEDPEEGQLMIIGNAFHKELFTNAREVLTNNGFLIDNGESYNTYIVATKENSDGNIVTVYVDSSDERPYITFGLTEVFKPGNNKEWSKEIQDTLNEELPEGVTLPYIYLGTVDPSISAKNYDHGRQISIVGGNWDDEVISLAYEYVSKSESDFTINATSETFTGYKLLEDKTAVRMRVSKNGDDLIQLDVYVDEKPEEVIEGFASWKDFPKTYGGGNVSDLMNQTIGSPLPEFLPLGLLPDSVSLSNPPRTENNYMKVSSYSSNFKPYYLYLAMDELEKSGYEVTFNPFAEREMPGFVAKKSDGSGKGTTMITLSSSSGYYYDDENGLRLSALYLPDMSKFEGTTDFAESDRININNALNDLPLPYVNLGSESLSIKTSYGEVSITGYNYSLAIIAGIKAAYVKAGWTIYDTYVVKNGQRYDTI